MLKTFPIEFIRIALLQTLFEEHLKNDYYIGGDDQINILSFYEQLKNHEEVERFVSTFRDIENQQNRTNLIGNGILLSPENPTITNLYSATIIPMTYSCYIRTKLSNRDQMIQTINNLIEELKGSKCDIAQLECEDEYGRTLYIPFKVGTIGHNEGKPVIKNGDFVGYTISGYGGTTVDNLIQTLYSQGIQNEAEFVYYSTKQQYEQPTANHVLKVARFINESGEVAGNVVIENFSVETQGYSKKLTGKIIFTSTSNQFKGVPKIDTFKLDKLIFQDSASHYEDIDDFNVPIDEASVIDGHLEIEGHFEIITQTDFDSTTTADYSDSLVEVSPIWREITEEDSDIPYPPTHTNFEEYKLSMSFEAIKCEEPRDLNGDEYCEIIFGGSATLVNSSVMLGNDLIKIAISKNKIVADTDITLSGDEYYLEPLEMPSGSNANTVLSQLTSNNFKQNSHTDGLGIGLQYSFVLDKNIPILKQWFDYARYGTYGVTVNDISPNMIYNLTEYWSSWGVVDIHTCLTKIVETIQIENTESDTLTIGVNLQIQGANN